MAFYPIPVTLNHIPTRIVAEASRRSNHWVTLVPWLLISLYLYPGVKAHGQSSEGSDVSSQYMYMPPHKRSFLEVRSLFQQGQIELELNDQDFNDQKSSSMFFRYHLGTTFWPKTLFSLSWDHYLFEKKTHFHSKNKGPQGPHDPTSSHNRGLSDPTFSLTRRIPGEMERDPIIDLFFSYSPQSGRALRGGKSHPGNVKRGSHSLGLGMRFGLENSSYQVMGMFYLHHFFAGEVHNLEKQEREKTSPHGHLGGTLGLQYSLLHPLTLHASGDLQVHNSQDLKKENEDNLGQGLSFQLSAGPNYQLGPDLLLISQFSVIFSHYRTPDKNDDREMASRNWEMNLGLRWQI